MKRLALVVLACGCDAASPDPGYGALLQIPGAQFRPGAFPAATGGPAALSVITTHAAVVIGNLHEKLHGVLPGTARAAIVGVTGEDGAWIVPAGPPDVDTTGDATVTATFGLARDAMPGPFELEVAATDATGAIGDAARVSLMAEPATPPDGALVIGVVWDSPADLDLHVVDPLGNEAWSGDPNTWKPPKDEPADPNAWLTGGILDHDGNAACHRDGAPSEHVIWKTRTGSNGPVDPIIPPGDYTVRVDTVSMCGSPIANWAIAAYRDGALVGASAGISTADDVIALPPDQTRAGAGVTALHVTLP
jgi:hypothetical protein